MRAIVLNDTKFWKNYPEHLPTRRFAPFFEIDRKKYHSLNWNPLKTKKIRERLPKDEYANIMHSVALTQYFATIYFPAYKTLVNEFVNEEWLALVDYHKTFHRDHIIHQPKVNWIGQNLLDLKIKSPVSGKKDTVLNHIVDVITGDVSHSRCETDYLKNYGKNIGLPIKYFSKKWVNKWRWKEFWWADVIKESFFLAALFHDIGYPVSFLKKIDENLNHQFPQEIFPVEHFLNFCRKYQERLMFYPFHDYQPIDSCSFPFNWESQLKELLNRVFLGSHSIQGVMTFFYLNDVIRKFPRTGNPRADKQFIVDLAALMILMHDLAGIYIKTDNTGRIEEIPYPQLRVKFHRDPFSFLLVMSDLLQDFGRSNAEFCYSKKGEEIKYKCVSKCREVRLEINETLHKLRIVYVYPDSKELFKQKHQFIPINQTKFFDKNYGYIDYTYLFNEIVLDAELK